MAHPIYGLSTKLLSDLNLADAVVVDDPAEFLGLRREEEEEVEEEEEDAQPGCETSFSDRHESFTEISPSKDRMTDVSWDEKMTEDDREDEEEEEEEVDENDDQDEFDETPRYGRKYAKSYLDDGDLADDEMEEQMEIRKRKKRKRAHVHFDR